MHKSEFSFSKRGAIIGTIVVSILTIAILLFSLYLGPDTDNQDVRIHHPSPTAETVVE